MGERKTRGEKRERCPAGSHWDETKQKCVAHRKKRKDEGIDEDEDED